MQRERTTVASPLNSHYNPISRPPRDHHLHAPANTPCTHTHARTNVFCTLVPAPTRLWPGRNVVLYVYAALSKVYEEASEEGRKDGCGTKKEDEEEAYNENNTKKKGEREQDLLQHYRATRFCSRASTFLYRRMKKKKIKEKRGEKKEIERKRVGRKRAGRSWQEQRCKTRNWSSLSGPVRRSRVHPSVRPSVCPIEPSQPSRALQRFRVLYHHTTTAPGWNAGVLRV